VDLWRVSHPGERVKYEYSSVPSLKRGPNGSFEDGDIANVLHIATESAACAFKARGIPSVLRVIEIMGIEQGRAWGACSLNEFRKSVGLKREVPSQSSPIPSPDICAQPMKALRNGIRILRSTRLLQTCITISTASNYTYGSTSPTPFSPLRHFQVGLQAEETKAPMPGAGLCPGYTVSRAILSDAVCLTRGDRFLTTEFTRASTCPRV